MTNNQKENIREEFRNKYFGCPCHDGEGCQCDYLQIITDYFLAKMEVREAETRAEMQIEIDAEKTSRGIAESSLY